MNLRHHRTSSKSSVTHHLFGQLTVTAIAIFLSALSIVSLTGNPVGTASALSSTPSIPPGYSTSLIAVRFRENTDVDPPEAALPVELRNSMVSITRLITLPKEKLDELRARGEARMAERSGVDRPIQRLPDMSLWFRITLKPETDAASFLEQLRSLDNVEIAEPAPRLALPANTPNFTGNQGYLNAAPGGIDAPYAWTFAGGNGSGITIYDVEYNWLQTHEDLSRASGVALLLNPGDSNAPPGYPGCDAPCDPFNREHGTAVLGELIADNDAKGVTGISWGANIGLAPAATTNLGENPTNAIMLAVADGDPGDVILIELQTPVCYLGEDRMGPIEWLPAVFNAIQIATANGYVVVEAAGNGNVDLDQPACGTTFNRIVRDSEAIIVGAGRPPNSGHDRERESFSSYGSRVDLQGWGSGVMTTGHFSGSFYSNPDDPTNPNFWYDNSFGGTSSAAAIVAGAVANLQGYAIQRSGASLNALQVRTLLVNTGSPQLGYTAEHIGPRPNLRAAIDRSRGDVNSDGRISLIDFEIWRREFLGEETTTNADFNGDGRVSLIDFEIWRRSFIG